MDGLLNIHGDAAPVILGKSASPSPNILDKGTKGKVVSATPKTDLPGLQWFKIRKEKGLVVSVEQLLMPVPLQTSFRSSRTSVWLREQFGAQSRVPTGRRRVGHPQVQARLSWMAKSNADGMFSAMGNGRGRGHGTWDPVGYRARLVAHQLRGSGGN